MQQPQQGGLPLHPTFLPPLYNLPWLAPLMGRVRITLTSHGQGSNYTKAMEAIAFCPNGLGVLEISLLWYYSLTYNGLGALRWPEMDALQNL